MIRFSLGVDVDSKAYNDYMMENALANFREGRLKEAVSICHEIINKSPDYYRAINLVGVCFTKIGDYSLALKWFNYALKINSDSQEIILNIDNVYRAQGDSDARVEWLLRYVSIDENDEVLLRLSFLFVEKKNYARGLEFSEKLISCNPDDFGSNLVYGVSLFHEGFGLASIPFLKKAVFGNPDNYTARSTLFIILLQNGMYEECMEVLTFCSGKVNDEAQNSIAMAIICWLRSDFEGAAILVKSAKNLMSEEGFVSSDEKFSRGFGQLLLSILIYREGNGWLYENNCSREVVFSVGESHALTINGAVLNLPTPCCVQSKIILGCKAWHLALGESSQYRSAYKRVVDSLPEEAFFVSFCGEIDCRTDEGIIDKHLRTGKPLSVYIEKTVEGYIEFVSESMKGRAIKVVISGVPAPRRNINPEILEKQNNYQVGVIYEFNEKLKSECNRNGFLFMDLYNETIDSDGFGRDDVYLDNDYYHLKPHVQARALEKVIEGV